MKTELIEMGGFASAFEALRLPYGKELTKIDMFSYQALRNIYIWRRHHRLPEWHEFCAFIEGLPLAKELITYGLDEERA